MIPYIPETAPFSTEQRAWLNGFFAGLFSVQEVGGDGRAGLEPAAPPRPLTLLFGSQTGTAEGLARKAAKRLAAAGFAPEMKALDDCDPAALAGVRHLLVVASTCGDGDMPDNARAFWDALSRDDAPRLDDTAFAVLALGDASYPDFCQAGKLLDARLAALGARRLHARVDCDVEVDEPFAAWLDAVTAALGDATGPDRGDGAVRRAVLAQAA